MSDAVSLAKEIYVEVLPVLLVSTGGGIIAGTVLGGEGMRAAIEAVPGLLLMLPAIMAMRGNIYGAMGARISTALHQGLIEPELRLQDRLQTAIAAALFNGVVIAVFIAVSSRIMLHVLGLPSASLLRLVSISLVATVLSAAALTTVLVTLLFWGYRRNMDPNVLNGPIVTTAGDVFEVAFLYLAVIIVGVIL